MTSTYTSSAVDFSYNEPKYQQYPYPYPYPYQEQEMQEAQEDYYYTQYDLQVANAVAEADYQDYYCEYQDQDQDEDEYMEEDDDEESLQYQQDASYDYRNDSLLSLVVGVQNYLTEQADLSSKCDSPLYNLQYKMYVYMRQRAIELGVQLWAFGPTCHVLLVIIFLFSSFAAPFPTLLYIFLSSQKKN